MPVHLFITVSHQEIHHFSIPSSFIKFSFIVSLTFRIDFVVCLTTSISLRGFVTNIEIVIIYLLI